MWTHQVTAPRLRTLRMSNVPEDCDLRLDLPNLEDVTIMYYNGSDAPINRMLKVATRLRSFDSYKLQGVHLGEFFVNLGELFSSSRRIVCLISADSFGRHARTPIRVERASDHRDTPC